MKFKTVIKLSTVAVVLSLSVIGCKKGMDKTTPIPGYGMKGVGQEEAAGPKGGITDPGKTAGNDNNTTVVNPTDGTPTSTTLTPTPPVKPRVDSGPVPLSGNLSSWGPAADQIFKSETVYFDYDKAIVKTSEIPKVDRVASGLKGLAGKALRIEGHCDERGTEEYNRSLGERRALGVREALIRAGVDPNLIDTISYGEDRPVDPGHNEAAWSKNRRGEFIVIEPPTAATSK